MSKHRRPLPFVIAICLFYSINVQADTVTDSLELALRAAGHDTSRISLLQKLSYTLASSDPARAISYAVQGIALAKKNGNKEAEANCLNNLGSGYESKGEYEKAMNAFLTAMHIHEKENNEFGCATEYSNIGFIFRQQQNYVKAIEFQRKALELYNKTGHNNNAAGCMVNIGNVYYNRGDYDSAIVQYQDALKIYQHLNDKESIATIENNTGAIYFEKADYERANEYFLKSYLIREQSNNKYEMATSLNNIGEVFGKLGQHDKAIAYCLHSLEVAKEIGAKDIMVYNYENLAGMYAATGKFQEAFRYQQLNSVIKDSILNVENNKQINELSVKYETDKKEKENQILKQTVDIQELNANKQRIILYSLSTLAIMLVSLAFLIFKGYTQTSKSRRSQCPLGEKK